jgi:hypothetical protein|nr:hypothetical protein [Kofleriaceae bacterium]
MTPGGVALAGHDAAYLRAVWLVASALGLALILALGVIYRRARGRRELEEAEAVLAAHDADDHRAAP